MDVVDVVDVVAIIDLILPPHWVIRRRSFRFTVGSCVPAHACPRRTLLPETASFRGKRVLGVVYRRLGYFPWGPSDFLGLLFLGSPSPFSSLWFLDFCVSLLGFSLV